MGTLLAVHDASPALALKQALATVMGVGVFVLATVGDVVIAAGVAGFFTLANTWLNARMHRQVKRIRQTARESQDVLRELADEGKDGDGS